MTTDEWDDVVLQGERFAEMTRRMKEQIRAAWPDLYAYWQEVCPRG